MCVFRVREHQMCLPIEQVQQVFEGREIFPVPTSPRAVLGLVNLRGMVVTAVDMHALLGLSDTEDPPASHLVAQCSDGMLSLLVDEVIGVIEVESDAMRATPSNVPANLVELSQGVVWMDDALYLIVDADAVRMAVA